MSGDRRSDPDASALHAEEATALERALAAAVRPEPLSPERHEAILRQVQLLPGERGAVSPEQDASSEPTAEERHAAERLAKALETGSEHPDAALARALAHAFGQSGPEDAAQRALDRALRRASPKPASRVIAIPFRALALAGSFAAAAAVLLFLGAESRVHTPARPALSRSLAPLFGPEAAELEPSARLDRIADARARDFRQNRYAAWGVP
jgi:hypothetical protein